MGKYYNRNNGSDELSRIIENAVNTLSSVAGEALDSVSKAFAEGHRSFNIHLKTDTPGERQVRPYKLKKAGYILKYVFAGLSLTAAAFFGTAYLINYAVGKIFTTGIVFGAVFFLLSSVLFISANAENSFQKLCRKYMSVIGLKPEVSLAYLSTVLNKKRSKVIRDINRLLDREILPSGAYVDKSKGILILDGEYDGADEPDLKAEEEAAPLSDYEERLVQLRRLNAHIKDPAVSERISTLEEYTRKIFEYVQSHPQSKGKIKTLLNYYLPTTVKLLESYSMIEEVGVAGENMKSTKESIEGTLDSLCSAFRKLLDELYGGEAMDISSDIEVLENMLKRDGIGDEDGFVEK